MIDHILRGDHSDDCNVAMSWAPEGKRKGKTKNHLETYSRERKARGWLETVGGGADRSNHYVPSGTERIDEIVISALMSPYPGDNPHNGPYGKSPPERGTFFKPQGL